MCEIRGKVISPLPLYLYPYIYIQMWFVLTEKMGWTGGAQFYR